MELKDYTTEELRAEIKRRNELAKEAKKQELRCRTWGKTYTRHYCAKLYTKACDEFENKIE